jgi:hypothetical protein
MCPACIENAAVMAAGVGSAGGVLAVCINRITKLFRTTGVGFRTRFNSLLVKQTSINHEGHEGTRRKSNCLF